MAIEPEACGQDRYLVNLLDLACILFPPKQRLSSWVRSKQNSTVFTHCIGGGVYKYIYINIQYSLLISIVYSHRSKMPVVLFPGTSWLPGSSCWWWTAGRWWRCHPSTTSWGKALRGQLANGLLSGWFQNVSHILDLQPEFGWWWWWLCPKCWIVGDGLKHQLPTRSPISI